MNTFRTINILDMIDAIGEESVNLILSDFSCPKNVEIIKSSHFYYASVSSNSLTDISYN